MSLDIDSFMSASTTEANDTQLLPIPTGDYTATIEKLELKEWSKEERSGIILNVFWNINDDSLREQLQRDKISCKQAVFLDITEDNQLDFGPGKNTRLGKLREALGMNTPGEPFAMMNMEGQMARVHVIERPGKDGDSIYNDVSAVASLDDSNL